MSLALRSSASYAADRPPTISRTDAKKSRKMFAPRMASPETSPKYLTAFFPSILGVVDRIITPLPLNAPILSPLEGISKSFAESPDPEQDVQKYRTSYPPAMSLPRQNHCPGTRLAANMAAAALLTLNDTDTAGKGSDTGVDIHE